ncbi:MAG: PAAR domain-containing protein [Synergistaceae bacterium]|nr:PAAR domain-containing protein [Synergistaceae bacterium]
MPACARVGDLCTGHGCWPPRPNDQGSPNVFVNGIPWHRQGDHWEPHTCPPIPETHDSILAFGSPTVFVNGKEGGRIGDPVACGSVVMTGSPDVFIGP